MQILAITQDKSLSQIFSEDSISSTAEFKIFDRTTDPLEVISMVHSISPNMLILDDDMLKPNSESTLKISHYFESINREISHVSDW